jgi:hypothetical protein
MASPGFRLWESLWSYGAHLSQVRRRPASLEDLEGIYGANRPGGEGSAARTAMADALGLRGRRERQSFLEAARRWARGRTPDTKRGPFRRLLEMAEAEQTRRRAGDRARALAHISELVGEYGLLIRRLEAWVRVSKDSRFREFDLTDYDPEDEQPGGGGLYLEPEELEIGVGDQGEDFYQALEGDDWETAALAVSTAFFDKYTGGAGGGEPTFLDDVDLLEVEIPGAQPEQGQAA